MYVTLLTRLRDIYFIINGAYGFSDKEDSRKSNTEDEFCDIVEFRIKKLFIEFGCPALKQTIEIRTNTKSV
jgi:hypothetical protein